MKHLDVKTSCGTTVSLAYELPRTLVFDCFVPGYGVCEADVDVGAEHIVINDVVERLDEHTRRMLPREFLAHDAVLEQASDVCAVFESVFDGSDITHDDVLTAIADMALHETELHRAYTSTGYWVPLSSRPMDEDDFRLASAMCLTHFIVEVLVERAQTLATKAAKQREKDAEALCESCAGSGEGYTPEGRCTRCDGRGVPRPVREWEDRP